MRSNLTIGTKLMASVGAGLVSTALIGYFGMASLSTMKGALDAAIEKTAVESQLANDMVAAQSGMVSAQRALLLSAFAKDSFEEETEKGNFRQNLQAVRKSLEQIRPLLVSAEGRTLVDNISAKLTEWQPQYDELVRLADAGNIVEANHLRQTVISPIYQKVDADAKRLAQQQVEFLAQSQQRETAEYERTRWIAFMLQGLGLAAGIVSILVVRDVNRSLRRSFAQLMDGAREVANTAMQVSASSQSLAQGASEQAASLEETNSSGKEINIVAQKNTESSRAAAELVTQSQTKVSEANRSLDEMVVAMGEINSSSEKISKIIRVIDEIAFQTNILALNAAVEAARAGEAGMGFAVVADEVRNLAQRSATAARDTAALIEGSISASQGGSVKVNDVAASIRGIAAESEKIKNLVDHVNADSQEQAKGVGAIGRALAQVEQITHQTAASAEESAAAAEELNAQSEALKRIVVNLASMVGGLALAEQD